MADFASQYMEQQDGTHEPTYWYEMAHASIDASDLANEDGDRDFSTHQLQQIEAQLREARIHNVPIPEFDIAYHLRYLLGAASEWPDPFVDPEIGTALCRLELDPAELGLDCIDSVIQILNGTDKLPAGASLADAAAVIQKYLQIFVGEAPANWNLLFSSLTRE
jgi:hypothetical protein